MYLRCSSWLLFAVQPLFGVEHSCHNLFKSRLPAYSTRVKHMPKIAPKSSTLSNPFIIFFYNRMTRIITVWFAWVLLPLLLFCFDLIPLPLTMVHSCSLTWSQIFSLNLQFASYFFTNNVFVICSLSLLFELKIVYNSHYYFVWILLNSTLFFSPCRNIVWKTGITRLIMFYQ